MPRPALAFTAGLFVLGFATKTAAMPFHAWLPDAHPSAPAPISAMLSGLLIKTLGIYALVRVFFLVVGVDERMRLLLTLLGCLSMWGRAARPGAGRSQADPRLPLGEPDGLRARRPRDRLLAGGGRGALPRRQPRPVQVGPLPLRRIARAPERHAPAVGNGGIFQRAPATAVGLVGSCLSIAGVPPFNGFWSKLLILIALVSAGQYLVALLAAGAALMTLVTFVKVQRKAVFGPLPARLAAARELPATMYLPVLALVVLCLLSGLLWPVGVDGVVGAAASAVRAPGEGGSAVEQYVEAVHGSRTP